VEDAVGLSPTVTGFAIRAVETFWLASWCVPEESNLAGSKDYWFTARPDNHFPV
jgi:hypothetical protein